ncbi:hypothetical protein AK830_g6532 [Neonectria ditissima]|uniref:O-methyltransferase domain-containing protein n=1 Tax=Neonectria ditissima TaxID=78410 RepID=A0A0P7BC55_9HYPO|nr:hypothetical protein AK830_g6532 [Neonectria ditissima]
MNPRDIAVLADEISKESEALAQLLRNPQSRGPCDDTRHPASELWNHPPRGSEIERSQSKLLGLTERLDRSLRGPQEVLHEFVASNWDRGALYCLLEHGVLELLPHSGSVTLAELAEKTAVPAEKLLPMLRLAACGEIVQEPTNENFRHGPISEELVADPGLKAFVGFQLFETRIASAHLADSLKKPNPFWTGQSAFKYAWGQSMYDWHKSHPEKGARFGAAMKSVTSSLDPGNQLLKDWFSHNIDGHGDIQHEFIDITRFPIQAPHFLAESHPSVLFKVQKFPDDAASFTVEETQTDHAHIYTLNSILWNLSDEDCIAILSHFLPLLEKSPNSVLLLNELLSPLPGTFEPHVDKAYRRRDVTVMTMHNAKLRTEKGWREIFQKASPNFEVSAKSAAMAEDHSR